MDKRMKRKALVAAAACLVCLAPAIILFRCSGAGKYNVLLITLDTTRADRLRCYGYKNIETPALNRLAREGVMFKNAYSHLPMTLPAHVSILSGTYPLYSGVIDNGGYRVPDELTTLPEILKSHGYATAAFVSAAVLKKAFNLNQGFDFWDEEDINPQKELSALVAERKGNLTTDAALKWLEKNYGEKWFLWVHYYDPHQEYAPPEPYFHLYFFDKYAGEIAFTDVQVKRLFQFLDQKKLTDKTIIIAIGDHGEGLGEHLELTHAAFIYNATQRVPFLVRVPGMKGPGKAASQVVGQVDLMPTVLDLLALPPFKEVQGRSLKKLILGQEPDSDAGEAFIQSNLPFLHYGWSELYGLATSNYKYIQAPKPELYDLEKDPGELENIAGKNEKLVKEFDFKIQQIKKSSRSDLAESAKKGAQLDDQTMKQLEALGYAASGPVADPERAKNKNPKDYADLLFPLTVIQKQLVAGEYQALLKTIEFVLKRDPENLQALRSKEKAYFGLGEYQKAIKWMDYVMKLTGENAEYYYLIGTCYIRMEQFAKAQAAFEKSIKLEPQKKLYRYYLARLLLQLGKREDALKMLDEAQIRDTWMGHLFLASYYRGQEGREGKVEAEYELALEQAPKSPLVKSEYAEYLLRIGRPKKALELLLEAEKEEPSFKADPNIRRFKREMQEAIEKGS